MASLKLVLLVETRPDIADRLAGLLQQAGVEVVVARSESEARESLQSLVSLGRERSFVVLASPASLETSRFGSDVRLAFGPTVRIVALESDGPPLHAHAVVPYPYPLPLVLEAIEG